jgi:MFS family permease
MKNQARRQEEPDETGSAQPDAPEALRFPPRERPTTRRRAPLDEPYDPEQDLATAQEIERAERERAVLEAREALTQARPAQGLDSVVWDAHEAIQSSLDEDPEERPKYVPIASNKQAPSTATSAVPGSVYVAPYNLPEHSPAPKATWLDVARRCLTTITAAGLLVVGFMMVLGDLSLSDAFSRRNAFLAPLLVAAIAWPVVGAALLASAVHSWFPDQRSARRQRAIGLSSAVVALAGAGWGIAASADLAWVSMVASLVMVAAAGFGVHQLNLLTARNRRERWLTDAPLEFALGWGAFSFCWSASALVSGFHVNVGPPAALGTLFLAVALVPVFVAGSTERGRLVPSIGFAWGVLWLLPACILAGQGVLMALAIVGVLIAFLVAMARRHAIATAERKA